MGYCGLLVIYGCVFVGWLSRFTCFDRGVALQAAFRRFGYLWWLGLFVDYLRCDFVILSLLEGY